MAIRTPDASVFTIVTFFYGCRTDMDIDRGVIVFANRNAALAIFMNVKKPARSGPAPHFLEAHLFCRRAAECGETEEA